MALLYTFNFDSEIFLFNILYSLLILLGFIIIFVIPAYLVYRIVEIIKKRYSKNQIPKKSISMLIFYGCISNLILTLFLTSVGLLNKSWVIYTIASFLVIGVILIDLIDMRFDFKKYFQMWKNRAIKLKGKLKDSFNWMLIASISVGILIILSSFLLPFPVGEDMIGHSFFLQLIYEQSNLIPELTGRIAPLIITSNVVQYPLFAHYIAVLNYAFVFPIANFTSPQFMNIYLKIWVLILPFTIRDLSTKIFGKKIGRIAFIMGFVFSPAYFVLWRWGGFAFVFGLIFFNITIFIFFSWKEYHIIEYFLISLISLLFVLISHTVVFTFAILVFISGSLLFIWLKISKRDELTNVKEERKPFYLSLIISIGFICGLILSAVTSTLLKYRAILNEHPFPYNLYLGIIGLIGAILLTISIYLIVKNKRKEVLNKRTKYFYISFYLGIILLLSTIIVAILFNPTVNNFLAKIPLVRSLLLSNYSTIPIRDFEFIGPTNPLLETESVFLTILIQFFANIYVNGLLAIVGLVLLIIGLKKEQDNIQYKLFTALVITSVCFLLYYGLSMIDVLSVLAFRFPLAFYMIRYERLFITFIINIAPIISAYTICKYIIGIRKAKREDITEQTGVRKFKKQFRNLFVNNKKIINYSIVIFISAITIGTFTYVGYFRTSLYYSNDVFDAAEWIIKNTDENEKFIVDSYGSWITFTTDRKISFAFLAGSRDVHRAIAITVRIIYELISDTAREIIYLDSLDYKYLYLSTAQPNDILNLFHYYMGYYYTFETFEDISYIDIVFRGETDMILYLNTSAFTYETYHPCPPFVKNPQEFLLSSRETIL